MSPCLRVCSAAARKGCSPSSASMQPATNAKTTHGPDPSYRADRNFAITHFNQTFAEAKVADYILLNALPNLEKPLRACQPVILAREGTKFYSINALIIIITPITIRPIPVINSRISDPNVSFTPFRRDFI